MSTNTGGPAFPQYSRDKWDRMQIAGGMTLRDWFAGQALAGVAPFIMGAAADAGAEGRDAARNAAIVAYSLADAMLKRREEEPK